MGRQKSLPRGTRGSQGSSTGEGALVQGALVQNMGLAFGAQDLTQVSINFYGVLRSLVDHLDPSAHVFGGDRLRNQVGGLHDGLKRVAEIVRKRAEFFG